MVIVSAFFSDDPSSNAYDTDIILGFNVRKK